VIEQTTRFFIQKSIYNNKDKSHDTLQQNDAKAIQPHFEVTAPWREKNIFSFGYNNWTKNSHVRPKWIM